MNQEQAKKKLIQVVNIRLKHFCVRLAIEIPENATQVIEFVLTFGILDDETNQNETNAEQKITNLREKMERLLESVTENDQDNFAAYINHNKGYNHNWSEAHVHAMNQLLEKNYQKIRNETWPEEQTLNLIDCLSIICWLLKCDPPKIKFLIRKKCLFLQDLFINLLVLYVLIHRNGHVKIQNPSISYLPNLKITPHVGVSPCDDLFQGIILREMHRILDIHIPENAQSNDDLARAVRDYFRHTLRQKKGWIGVEQGVLTVIKDQCRYMMMRSEHLWKNFVVSRTRTPLNRVANEYRNEWEHVDDYIQMVFTNAEILAPRRSFMHVKYVKWLLKKQPADDNLLEQKISPALESWNKETNILLNSIHHAILNNETLEYYGSENHPTFLNEASNKGYINTPNYLKFLTEFARSTISKATHKKILARQAIALQQVIALRSYIVTLFSCIEAYKKDFQSHTDMIIFLVAFRALLMYKLPINTYPYGVQQVAKELPKYTRRLALIFPSDVSKPKACQCNICIYYISIIALLFYLFSYMEM